MVNGSGVHSLILPWRNNLSLYVSDGVYNSNFSTLMMLSTTAILVIWLVHWHSVNAGLRLEGTRERIKFWRERLIIKSVRELGFRGTQFHMLSHCSAIQQLFIVLWQRCEERVGILAHFYVVHNRHKKVWLQEPNAFAVVFWSTSCASWHAFTGRPPSGQVKHSLKYSQKKRYIEA